MLQSSRQVFCSYVMLLNVLAAYDACSESSLPG